jgi:hypothetical protein
MKFLKDLLKEKNKMLVRYNQVLKDDTGIMSVFNFSNINGGTYDSFKFYNDYVVIDKRKEVKYE